MATNNNFRVKNNLQFTNPDTGITFSDDSVQTTAFTGNGNIGFQNDWIKNTAGEQLYISPQDGNTWINIPSDAQAGDGSSLDIVNNVGNVKIHANTKEFLFGVDGLTFPDSTIQTTAYAGSKGYSKFLAGVTSLTAADAGAAVQLWGNDCSLPEGSTTNQGDAFTFTNEGGNVQKITTAAGSYDFIFHGSVLNTNSLDVLDGETVVIASRGNGEWDIVGGTLSMRYQTTASFNQIAFPDGTIQTTAYIGSPPPVTFSADVLVVAGGGGGGDMVGGGGGAGGIISTTVNLSTGTTYTITVGAGGSLNSDGSNSTFDTLTAIGGGGGQGNSSSGVNGHDGGSGGGGGGGVVSGGAGTSGQGHNAGNTTEWSGYYGCGGGGGASSSGTDGTSAGGGNGGDGIISTLITDSDATTLGVGQVVGTDVYFGGGGGGGSFNDGPTGSGGLGGGASGTLTGSAHTGGGGGGSTGNTSNGGSGGSGVVIVSVPTANYSGTYTGTPDIVTNGSNTVLVFTSNGSYTA